MGARGFPPISHGRLGRGVSGVRIGARAIRSRVREADPFVYGHLRPIEGVLGYGIPQRYYCTVVLLVVN